MNGNAIQMNLWIQDGRKAMAHVMIKCRKWLFFLLIFFVGKIPVEAQPPHILVLIADDHSQMDCEPYGSSEVRTPFLRHLAESGMRFDRAFVNSPSCAPSRAALLTGMTPPHNGAEPNHSRPRADLTKLPQELKKLGYEVVAFGKVSHYQHTADYGFDYFAYDTFQDHRGIEAAREWLKNRKGTKPVALFVGSNWPHVPWPPVDGYSPEQVHVGKNHIDTPVFRSARAQYLTAVTAMDTELGSVYETAMEVLGAEKTFVLFTSDHGAQLPFGKWNLYDEGTKVPLIVKWPGVVKSGSETKAMVQWMDIMPTLMEVGGGMSGSGNFDGKSFVKVLRGESQNHHEWIYTTHSNDNNMNVYPMRSVRSERYKLIWNLHPEFQFTTHIDRSDEAPSRQYWMSWENRAKADQTAAKLLSRYHVRPELELYDLENDPLELRNLAGLPEHSERVEAMKAQITDWMKQQGDQQKVVGKPLMVGEPIPLIRRPAAKKKASAKQKRAE